MGGSGQNYMNNPGSVQNAAEMATGHVLVGMEEGLTAKAAELKETLLGAFSSSGFSPDDNEIYANRADIKAEFRSAHIAATANGTPMDPEIAERMEQLAEKFPDEVKGNMRTALEGVKANPQEFGLETGKTGLFSDNAGVEFSAATPG